MLSAISSNFTQFISWVGEIITALTGESGALKDLLPLFSLGIAASVLMLSMKLIRKVSWGA